jgi:hypothetical protein
MMDEGQKPRESEVYCTFREVGVHNCSIPVRGKRFLFPIVQTGCGAHPASCVTGTGGVFPPELRRPEREDCH